MQRIIFKKVYELSDLNTIEVVTSLRKYKSKIKILIIDDKPFPYIDELRNDDYHIKWIKDISDFNAVVEYPIVITDIKGVGISFDSVNQGLYVAQRIKTDYPFKQVAVYSGEANYTIGATSQLDGIYRFNKDIEKEQWISNLNELIRKVSDPREVWITLRSYLLSQSVSTCEVMKLESNYVDIYLNRPKDLSKFPEHDKFPDISNDIRGVIQSIIANLIFSLKV